MRVILFADNDRDFLETRSEFLETEGYAVLKASSPQEARDVLDRKRVHLAILDIRLTDDSDGDISGLELAQEDAYRSLPKIMLTGFPTVEAVKTALKPVLDRMPPAVDFISKKRGADALIEAIEQAFDQYVRINWDLNVRWGRQGQLLPAYLANLIIPHLSSDQLSDQADELEDLLRKLFHDYSQVTIDRILTRRDGWILLAVFAYPADGPEEQFVVACGQRANVQAEEDCYRSYVPHRAGDRAASQAQSAETVHFRATGYRLGGCMVDEVVPFSDFYRGQSGGMVQAAVDDLFQIALRPWYARERENRAQPIGAFCRQWVELEDGVLTEAELEERVVGICREALTVGITGLDCSSHRLVFRPSEGAVFSYPNPAPYLCGERITVSPPTLCGITHGRLDGVSVLVDRAGRTWVVDFGRTGVGPLVRDFVCLETAVKFDMLTGASAAERHELERRFLAAEHLRAEPGEELDASGLGPGVEKALQVVSRIRHRSADVVGPEMEPYLAGLLFCATRRFLGYQPGLRYTRDEIVALVHVLFSLGMICRRLVVREDRLQDLPQQAAQSLWIDEENHEVWVEGRLVTLSPQVFRLLKYLYDHANQLCTRSAIAKHVFNSKISDLRLAEANLIEKDQINTNVSRLRGAIEPNPSHPKYVVTVRGLGYRLVLEDVPVPRDE
jgi:DNA-binding response OmpR family regulator